PPPTGDRAGVFYSEPLPQLTRLDPPNRHPVDQALPELGKPWRFTLGQTSPLFFGLAWLKLAYTGSMWTVTAQLARLNHKRHNDLRGQGYGVSSGSARDTDQIGRR